MKSSKRLYTWTLLAAASAMAAACGTDKQETQQAAADSVPVQTMQVGMQQADSRFSFPARVQAEESAQLSTRLMGQIEQLNVDAGDRVRKGQVLAVIRSTDLQANLERVKAQQRQAEAAMRNAQKDYERMGRLFAQKSATQKQLDDITTHYEAMKANVEALKQAEREVNVNLGYASIRAPFDGVVTAKMAQSGDMANPGMPLLTLSSAGRYKVVAQVPEQEVGTFRSGQAVGIYVDALGRELPGTIDKVVPSGRYNAGQFEVSVRLGQQPEQLTDGLYARMSVQGAKAAGTPGGKLLVPRSALYERGQLTGVFVVNQQGEAALRWLRLGKTYGEQVEVLSGLMPGEQLILSQQLPLSDGQPVKVARK